MFLMRLYGNTGMEECRQYMTKLGFFLNLLTNYGSGYTAFFTVDFYTLRMVQSNLIRCFIVVDLCTSSEQNHNSENV